MSERQVTSVTLQLDELRIVTLTDGEVWSARDIMAVAGYDRWERFSDAINRAIASVNASGLDASEHFRGAAKSSPMPNGGFRQVEDVELTRYGCYVLFQNADARKPEIAAMQSYFAVQTRKQEIAEQAPAFDPTTVEGAQLLITAAQTALAKLAEIQPAADAWNELASAEGDYDVADAAKILARAGIPTGRTRLFASMESFQWIYRGSDREWRVYARAVDAGYLAEKPQFHYHLKSGERVIDAPQVRVTIKGLERLRTRLHVGALQAVSA